ncbi:MAG: YodL domain-containing protein [Prevotellaceae bacterium]|nr:YodL domain-containing protein [Prevotellaceae bacterium]
MSENSYAIYQLKQSSENMDRAFMPLKYLYEKHIPVQREKYALVYRAQLEDGETLDDLYLKFNMNHPSDYTGHSLSISDVVVLRRDGTETAFYVDDMGFSEVPEFLNEDDVILFQGCRDTARFNTAI